MKIGTFTEARHSLVERFRKNMLGHRGFMVVLWCHLALMMGFTYSYLVVRVSIAYTLRQVDAHPNQSTSSSLDLLLTFCRAGFWVFVIGLPAVALALGICGILPGTHRKKSV
jgi:hypothetical protein